MNAHTDLATILAALQSGPKTNWELAEITLRYGARLYDLRQQGYEIETIHEGTPGRFTYALID